MPRSRGFALSQKNLDKAQRKIAKNAGKLAGKRESVRAAVAEAVAAGTPLKTSTVSSCSNSDLHMFSGESGTPVEIVALHNGWLYAQGLAPGKDATGKDVELEGAISPSAVQDGDAIVRSLQILRGDPIFDAEAKLSVSPQAQAQALACIVTSPPPPAGEQPAKAGSAVRAASQMINVRACEPAAPDSSLTRMLSRRAVKSPGPASAAGMLSPGDWKSLQQGTACYLHHTLGPDSTAKAGGGSLGTTTVSQSKLRTKVVLRLSKDKDTLEVLAADSTYSTAAFSLPLDGAARGSVSASFGPSSSSPALYGRSDPFKDASFCCMSVVFRFNSGTRLEEEEERQLQGLAVSLDVSFAGGDGEPVGISDARKKAVALSGGGGSGGSGPSSSSASDCSLWFRALQALLHEERNAFGGGGDVPAAFGGGSLVFPEADCLCVSRGILLWEIARLRLRYRAMQLGCPTGRMLAVTLLQVAKAARAGGVVAGGAGGAPRSVETNSPHLDTAAVVAQSAEVEVEVEVDPWDELGLTEDQLLSVSADPVEALEGGPRGSRSRGSRYHGVGENDNGLLDNQTGVWIAEEDKGGGGGGGTGGGPGQAEMPCLRGWRAAVLRAGTSISGRGTFRWRSGDEYTGSFADGGASAGDGEFRWADGSVYTGRWSGHPNIPSTTSVTSHGRMVYADADSYDGQWDRGRKHGWGKYSWAGDESRSYDGQWREDNWEGHGVLTGGGGGGGNEPSGSTGDVYDGQFRANLRHGRGTLKAVTFQYTGQWYGGNMEGEGTYSTGPVPDGADIEDMQCGTPGDNSKLFPPGSSRFQGTFNLGVRVEGPGIYSWGGSGNVYEGQWKALQRCGQGKMTWRNSGNVYEGEWLADLKHGTGKMTTKANDVFEGRWEEGKQAAGPGSFSWKANGNRYDGNWENSKMHGPGRFSWANGDAMEAEWSAGLKQDGAGVFTTLAGDRYEGQFKGDCKHGEGVYQWTGPKMKGLSSSSSGGGDRYEGGWKDNMFQGKGKMRYCATGDVYEGEWRAGLHSGEGTLLEANGDRYEGQFQGGERGGKGVQTCTGVGASGPLSSRVRAQQKEQTPPSGASTGRSGNHTAGSTALSRDLQSFDGDWVSSLPQGEGHGVYFNGDEFEGAWEEGKPEGFGTLTFGGSTQTGGFGGNTSSLKLTTARTGHQGGDSNEGSTLAGLFKEGCLSDGQAVYVGGDRMRGYSYDGEWVDSQMHGVGVHSEHSNGDVFTGGFEKGCKHGMGKVEYGMKPLEPEEEPKGGKNSKNHALVKKAQPVVNLLKGCSLECEWVDGTENGFGTFTWGGSAASAVPADVVSQCSSAEGCLTFEGSWVAGTLFDGSGVFLESAHGMGGVSFGGDEGSMKSPNVYRGPMTAGGLKHGLGSMWWGNGDSYEGGWVDDNMSGTGKLMWSNGDMYQGGFRAGKLEGKGKHTSVAPPKAPLGAFQLKAEVYEGHFVASLRDGKGKVTYGGGDVYEGGWSAGLKQGWGKLSWVSGSSYEGMFEEGTEKEGEGTFLVPFSITDMVKKAKAGTLMAVYQRKGVQSAGESAGAAAGGGGGGGGGEVVRNEVFVRISTTLDTLEILEVPSSSSGQPADGDPVSKTAFPTKVVSSVQLSDCDDLDYGIVTDTMRRAACGTPDGRQAPVLLEHPWHCFSLGTKDKSSSLLLSSSAASSSGSSSQRQQQLLGGKGGGAIDLAVLDESQLIPWYVALQHCLVRVNGGDEQEGSNGGQGSDEESRGLLLWRACAMRARRRAGAGLTLATPGRPLGPPVSQQIARALLLTGLQRRRVHTIMLECAVGESRHSTPLDNLRLPVFKHVLRGDLDTDADAPVKASSSSLNLVIRFLKMPWAQTDSRGACVPGTAESKKLGSGPLLVVGSPLRLQFDKAIVNELSQALEVRAAELSVVFACQASGKLLPKGASAGEAAMVCVRYRPVIDEEADGKSARSEALAAAAGKLTAALGKRRAPHAGSGQTVVSSHPPHILTVAPEGVLLLADPAYRCRNCLYALRMQAEQAVWSSVGDMDNDESGLTTGRATGRLESGSGTASEQASGGRAADAKKRLTPEEEANHGKVLAEKCKKLAEADAHLEQGMLPFIDVVAATAAAAAAEQAQGAAKELLLLDSPLQLLPSVAYAPGARVRIHSLVTFEHETGKDSNSDVAAAVVVASMMSSNSMLNPLNGMQGVVRAVRLPPPVRRPTVKLLPKPFASLTSALPPVPPRPCAANLAEGDACFLFTIQDEAPAIAAAAEAGEGAAPQAPNKAKRVHDRSPAFVRYVSAQRLKKQRSDVYAVKQSGGGPESPVESLTPVVLPPSLHPTCGVLQLLAADKTTVLQSVPDDQIVQLIFGAASPILRSRPSDMVDLDDNWKCATVVVSLPQHGRAAAPSHAAGPDDDDCPPEFDECAEDHHGETAMLDIAFESEDCLMDWFLQLQAAMLVSARVEQAVYEKIDDMHEIDDRQAVQDKMNDMNSGDRALAAADVASAQSTARAMAVADEEIVSCLIHSCKEGEHHQITSWLRLAADGSGIELLSKDQSKIKVGVEWTQMASLAFGARSTGFLLRPYDVARENPSYCCFTVLTQAGASLDLSLPDKDRAFEWFLKIQDHPSAPFSQPHTAREQSDGSSRVVGILTRPALRWLRCALTCQELGAVHHCTSSQALVKVLESAAKAVRLEEEQERARTDCIGLWPLPPRRPGSSAHLHWRGANRANLHWQRAHAKLYSRARQNCTSVGTALKGVMLQARGQSLGEDMLQGEPQAAPEEKDCIFVEVLVDEENIGLPSSSTAPASLGQASGGGAVNAAAEAINASGPITVKVRPSRLKLVSPPPDSAIEAQVMASAQDKAAMSLSGSGSGGGGGGGGASKADKTRAILLQSLADDYKAVMPEHQSVLGLHLRRELRRQYEIGLVNKHARRLRAASGSGPGASKSLSPIGAYLIPKGASWWQSSIVKKMGTGQSGVAGLQPVLVSVAMQEQQESAGGGGGLRIVITCTAAPPAVTPAGAGGDDGEEALSEGVTTKSSSSTLSTPGTVLLKVVVDPRSQHLIYGHPPLADLVSPSKASKGSASKTSDSSLAARAPDGGHLHLYIADSKAVAGGGRAVARSGTGKQQSVTAAKHIALHLRAADHENLQQLFLGLQGCMFLHRKTAQADGGASSKKKEDTGSNSRGTDGKAGLSPLVLASDKASIASINPNAVHNHAGGEAGDASSEETGKSGSGWVSPGALCWMQVRWQLDCEASKRGVDRLEVVRSALRRAVLAHIGSNADYKQAMLEEGAREYGVIKERLEVEKQNRIQTELERGSREDAACRIQAFEKGRKVRCTAAERSAEATLRRQKAIAGRFISCWATFKYRSRYERRCSAAVVIQARTRGMLSRTQAEREARRLVEAAEELARVRAAEEAAVLVLQRAFRCCIARRRVAHRRQNAEWYIMEREAVAADAKLAAAVVASAEAERAQRKADLELKADILRSTKEEESARLAEAVAANTRARLEDTTDYKRLAKLRRREAALDSWLYKGNVLAMHSVPPARKAAASTPFQPPRLVYVRVVPGTNFDRVSGNSAGGGGGGGGSGDLSSDDVGTPQLIIQDLQDQTKLLSLCPVNLIHSVKRLVYGVPSDVRRSVWYPYVVLRDPEWCHFHIELMDENRLHFSAPDEASLPKWLSGLDRKMGGGGYGLGASTHEAMERLRAERGREERGLPVLKPAQGLPLSMSGVLWDRFKRKVSHACADSRDAGMERKTVLMCAVKQSAAQQQAGGAGASSASSLVGSYFELRSLRCQYLDLLEKGSQAVLYEPGSPRPQHPGQAANAAALKKYVAGCAAADKVPAKRSAAYVALDVSTYTVRWGPHQPSHSLQPCQYGYGRNWALKNSVDCEAIQAVTFGPGTARSHAQAPVNALADPGRLVAGDKGECCLILHFKQARRFEASVKGRASLQVVISSQEEATGWYIALSALTMPASMRMTLGEVLWKRVQIKTAERSIMTSKSLVKTVLALVRDAASDAEGKSNSGAAKGGRAAVQQRTRVGELHAGSMARVHLDETEGQRMGRAGRKTSQPVLSSSSLAKSNGYVWVSLSGDVAQLCFATPTSDILSSAGPNQGTYLAASAGVTMPATGLASGGGSGSGSKPKQQAVKPPTILSTVQISGCSRVVFGWAATRAVWEEDLVKRDGRLRPWRCVSLIMQSGRCLNLSFPNDHQALQWYLSLLYIVEPGMACTEGDLLWERVRMRIDFDTVSTRASPGVRPVGRPFVLTRKQVLLEAVRKGPPGTVLTATQPRTVLPEGQSGDDSGANATETKDANKDAFRQELEAKKLAAAVSKQAPAPAPAETAGPKTGKEKREAELKMASEAASSEDAASEGAFRAAVLKVQRSSMKVGNAVRCWGVDSDNGALSLDPDVVGQQSIRWLILSTDGSQFCLASTDRRSPHLPSSGHSGGSGPLGAKKGSASAAKALHVTPLRQHWFSVASVRRVVYGRFGPRWKRRDNTGTLGGKGGNCGSLPSLSLSSRDDWLRLTIIVEPRFEGAAGRPVAVRSAKGQGGPLASGDGSLRVFTVVFTDSAAVENWYFGLHSLLAKRRPLLELHAPLGPPAPSSPPPTTNTTSLDPTGSTVGMPNSGPMTHGRFVMVKAQCILASMHEQANTTLPKLMARLVRRGGQAAAVSRGGEGVAAPVAALIETANAAAGAAAAAATTTNDDEDTVLNANCLPLAELVLQQRRSACLTYWQVMECGAVFDLFIPSKESVKMTPTSTLAAQEPGTSGMRNAVAAAHILAALPSKKEGRASTMSTLKHMKQLGVGHGMMTVRARLSLDHRSVELTGLPKEHKGCLSHLPFSTTLFLDHRWAKRVEFGPSSPGFKARVADLKANGERHVPFDMRSCFTLYLNSISNQTVALDFVGRSKTATVAWVLGMQNLLGEGMEDEVVASQPDHSLLNTADSPSLPPPLETSVGIGAVSGMPQPPPLRSQHVNNLGAILWHRARLNLQQAGWVSGKTVTSILIEAIILSSRDSGGGSGGGGSGSDFADSNNGIDATALTARGVGGSSSSEPPVESRGRSPPAMQSSITLFHWTTKAFLATKAVAATMSCPDSSTVTVKTPSGMFGGSAVKSYRLADCMGLSFGSSNATFGKAKLGPKGVKGLKGVAVNPDTMQSPWPAGTMPPPWHCFSLVFPASTIDVACASQEEAMDWMLHFRTVLSANGAHVNCKSQGLLRWQRVQMKLAVLSAAAASSNEGANALEPEEEPWVDATERIASMFKAIDSGNTGLITPDELRQVFALLGEHIDSDDVELMITEVDSDHDGAVSLEELTVALS